MRRTRCRPRWHRPIEAIGAAVIAASLIAVPGLAGAAPSAAAAAVNAPSGTAPGGPGTQSYLDVARKDCFGTARNTTSKVWFTVADGVLSDAYYPTIESSNVNTLQYIVTDGKTFADLQERDMTYTVSSPDRSGMVCQVTSTDARHGFQIVTDYITDPATDSIVMHSRLVPLPGRRSGFGDLKVYVRYNPHIDNTGGGGSSNGGANNAEVDPATTALVATDTEPATGPGPFAATVYGALAASKPFLAESAGFAGTPSDGLSQLDASHALTSQYQSADDGNVTLTAQVNAAPGTPFTLALGFGSTAVKAINSAERSSVQPFGNTLVRYLAGWRRYDSTLRPPPNSLPGLSAAADAAMRGQYWLSANVLKADEDKTYLGAFTAPGAVATPPSTSTAAPTITEDILASQEPGLTTQQAQATVSGKTAPGATVDIVASQPGTNGNATVIVQAVAGPDGSFRAVVPTPPGQSILTVSVTAAGHATGWAQQTVTAS
jgi:glucoamylase